MKAKYNKYTTILLLSIAVINILSTSRLSAQNNVIDKIIAVVGENEILFSDVENQYMQYKMQNYTSNSDAVRCHLFEEMLFAKLLLNQAQLDSVEISDEMLDNEMDRRLQYFVSRIGSQEQLEEYYGKTIMEIKTELRKNIYEQMLSEQIKRDITEGVKITPTEVKEFFEATPKDSIPLIGSEIEYSSIIMTPMVRKEEKAYAYEKLKGIRERIIKGENFSTLARIYSDDPGSSMKGGELGDFSRGVMYPEFEAAAFALKNDTVSEIIETEAGYHILQLIRRKGDYINVRHILVMTKISPVSLKIAKNKIDSVYALIESGKMTFEDAALKFSDDDSKYSKGMAINPNTGNTFFSPEQLNKDLFYRVDNMNIGEVSKAFLYQDETGKKDFRIVRLDSRTKPHKASMETDYDKIQQYALDNKKNKVVGDWINLKAQQTYIKILDDNFKKCNFTYNWE